MSVLPWLTTRVFTDALQHPLLSALKVHAIRRTRTSTSHGVRQLHQVPRPHKESQTLGDKLVALNCPTRRSVPFRTSSIKRIEGRGSISLLLSSDPPSHHVFGVKSDHVRFLSSRTSKRRESKKRPTISEDADLSQSEVEKIFGEPIEPEKGVEILSTLQEQRRRGTLDQETHYPPRLVAKGLEYLRAKYAMDEEAAIVARVDRELDGEWNLPQKNTSRSPTARSGLQEIRRISREKYEAEKARREAEIKRREAEEKQKREQEAKRGAKALVSRRKDEVVADDGKVQVPGENARVSQRTARLWQEATTTAIPQLSFLERISPSGIFTMGIIAAALLFASFYTPPAPEARMFPEMPPAAAFMGLVIGLNVLVWWLWKVPSWWKVLNKYMIVVPATPRSFQMLGAEFSHQTLKHLGANMLAMWFVGAYCESYLRPS